MIYPSPFSNEAITEQTLRGVLRHPPSLNSIDSLERVAQLMRLEPMGMLPVTENGKFVGVIRQTDLIGLLEESDILKRSEQMQAAVSSCMRTIDQAIEPSDSIDIVRKKFLTTHLPMLPVVDAQGYLLGVVASNDLLVDNLPSPHPARIGGMATPFGVYLTDGNSQAGVGNWALVSTGLMLGFLMTLTVTIAWGMVLFARKFVTFPVGIERILTGDTVPNTPFFATAALVISTVLTLMFLWLMHNTPLAGYHAAEHQTVHAIERHEQLKPDIVSRMPRAHPRCGTNIMAAMMLFYFFRQLFGYFDFLTGYAEILAALGTLYTFRPIGTFIQEKFTTKPANYRELASGIAAGNDLLHKYLNAPPSRPTVFRRIWCSGMIQVAMGALPFILLLELSRYLPIRW